MNEVLVGTVGGQSLNRSQLLADAAQVLCFLDSNCMKSVACGQHGVCDLIILSSCCDSGEQCSGSPGHCLRGFGIEFVIDDVNVHRAGPMQVNGIPDKLAMPEEKVMEPLLGDIGYRESAAVKGYK